MSRSRYSDKVSVAISRSFWLSCGINNNQEICYSSWFEMIASVLPFICFDQVSTTNLIIQGLW